ncbi:Mfa1 family fimbria major subunit [Bacteroides sp. 519]|uniref:Mfa1 family fimbria major subunit n=1 Tax=Bacteroides sp. 519 TaxID=2302937 RepID=UPI0013D1E3E1|nr:Mfa1 family fimbria major subunit [Bacteroides sp. 519]
MKMNFKYVMLACATLMAGFTSCSNEENLDGAEIIPNGKATVAEIVLTQQANSTRAISLSSTPTAAESVINKATLYIFNASKRLVKQVDFAPTTNVKTVELTTGTHYFHALVNHPGTAPVFSANSTLAAVTAHLNNEIPLTNIGFITTGPSGFLMSTLGDPVAKNLVEATEAEAATKNPVELKVGRAMAKLKTLFEATDRATQQPATGVLGNVKYQGANNPNKMYALPNYVGTQLEAPYFTTYSDPNVVDQTKYFPTLPGDFTMTTGWVNADGAESNIVYLVENSNKTPKEGNSTFVLLKGTFSPEATYCYNGADGTELGSAIPTGTTFWCAATADKKIVYKKKFFNSAPTSAVLAALTTNLNDGNTYTEIIEYNNGEAYYAFFLQDELQSTRVAKFTTARNNYYGVTINSVSDLGANTPKGVVPDKETPLGAKAWVQGTITILNWSTVTQTGGI